MSETLTDHNKKKTSPTKRVLAVARKAVHAVTKSSERSNMADEVAVELNADLFKEYGDAGYDQFTQAAGNWGSHLGSTNPTRVLHEWALYHPDGRVSRLTQYKFENPLDPGRSVRSSFHRADYTSQVGYDQHVEDWGLNVTERQPFHPDEGSETESSDVA